jgi:endonuclease/exonuclease/phosphatase family metal-dependent hydrolase
MKRILHLAALFLLPNAGMGTEPIARITAWNVACGRSDNGGTPIPKDRIERQGKVIAEKIKPDVLLLEEVWEAGAAEDLARASTAAGHPLEALKVPAQSSGVVQLLAILKRPGVDVQELQVVEGSEDLVDGDDPSEKSSRKAISALVTIGEFDFYLVGVHLKSKLAGNGTAKMVVDMRDRQCRAIANWIKKLTEGKEKDVLLLGDYNMTPDSEFAPSPPPKPDESDQRNFDSLNSSGKLRFLSSEVKGGTHLSSYNGKVERSKLDGYAIATATEEEFVAGSFRVLDALAIEAAETQFTEKKSADFLSDHYPISAEFRTDKDDD